MSVKNYRAVKNTALNSYTLYLSRRAKHPESKYDTIIVNYVTLPKSYIPVVL